MLHQTPHDQGAYGLIHMQNPKKERNTLTEAPLKLRDVAKIERVQISPTCIFLCVLRYSPLILIKLVNLVLFTLICNIRNYFRANLIILMKLVQCVLFSLSYDIQN